jgi:hypothetical protein
VRWYEWLQPGGVLTIETPDFARCVDVFAERPSEDQALILRHLFGSQEAAWAQHRDGWSAARFRHTLPLLGFERVVTESTSSDERGLLPNVVARAFKPEVAVPRDARTAAALALLRQAMNGRNPTEERLATRWAAVFERTLDGGAGDPVTSGYLP